MGRYRGIPRPSRGYDLGVAGVPATDQGEERSETSPQTLKGMTTLIGIIAGLSLAAFLLIWIVAALRR